MGRPRIYASNAERQRAFQDRRRQELELLRQKVARRPRHTDDVYLTPPAFAAAGLERVTITPARILDVGAGPGVWGQAARARWPKAEIIGVELRELSVPPDYDQWWTGDFLALAEEMHARVGPVDLVMGNPPFKPAEACVRAGLRLLAPAGELLFFLRLAFSEGQTRARGLFAEHPLTELSVCDRRPRFYGEGNGMTAFAYFRWQEGFAGTTALTTSRIPRLE